ncbi:MAG: glycosyltransferase family 9 protein [Oligoflexia bacterium]|nr:glycosyltransferase family 9 protein [Oligoflexia bacterium]
MRKVLIIRFSSFGDIVQASSVLPHLKDSEVHWLTKSNFTNLVECFSNVSKIISFEKEKGLLGLIKLGFQIANENYDVVYDAHNNTRSLILRMIFFFFKFKGIQVIVRPKNRWKRILLFNFRINKFDWPFRGALSYLEPLHKEKFLPQEWKLDNLKVDLPYEDYIVFAPSAAWEMKRWPLDYWKELAKSLSTMNIIILGGPEDLFCQEIEDIDPRRITNLAGKVSLNQSSYIVSKSHGIISADTGIIHVADVLGVKGISLIGPTAFGYCSGENIKTLEVELPCKPCSKDGSGKCSQAVYQKCMVDISVEQVASNARASFSSSIIES